MGYFSVHMYESTSMEMKF